MFLKRFHWLNCLTSGQLLVKNSRSVLTLLSCGKEWRLAYCLMPILVLKSKIERDRCVLVVNFFQLELPKFLNCQNTRDLPNVI